jgi:hypothetical protein
VAQAPLDAVLSAALAPFAQIKSNARATIGGTTFFELLRTRARSLWSPLRRGRHLCRWAWKLLETSSASASSSTEPSLFMVSMTRNRTVASRPTRCCKLFLPGMNLIGSVAQRPVRNAQIASHLGYRPSTLDKRDGILFKLAVIATRELVFIGFHYLASFCEHLIVSPPRARARGALRCP